MKLTNHAERYGVLPPARNMGIGQKGVFTLVLLMKESVKELFAANNTPHIPASETM